MTDDPRERERVHQELITDGEVRQLVHALQPYGILGREQLSAECSHHGWHENGFDTALTKAVSAGVIESLPGDFYKLVGDGD